MATTCSVGGEQSLPEQFVFPSVFSLTSHQQRALISLWLCHKNTHSPSDSVVREYKNQI